MGISEYLWTECWWKALFFSLRKVYNTQSVDMFFFLHYGKETENEEELAHTKKLGDKENIEKLPDNSGLWTSLRLKTNS